MIGVQKGALALSYARERLSDQELAGSLIAPPTQVLPSIKSYKFYFSTRLRSLTVPKTNNILCICLVDKYTCNLNGVSRVRILFIAGPAKQPHMPQLFGDCGVQKSVV